MQETSLRNKKFNWVLLGYDESIMKVKAAIAYCMYDNNGQHESRKSFLKEK